MPLRRRFAARRLLSTGLVVASIVLIVAPQAFTSTRLVPHTAAPSATPVAAPAPAAVSDRRQVSESAVAVDTKAALDAARKALGEALGHIGTSPSASDKAQFGDAVQKYVEAVTARQAYIVERLAALGAYLKANGITPGSSHPDPLAVQYAGFEQEFAALDTEVQAYRPAAYNNLHADQVTGPDSALVTNCDQNFDSVTPPALPSGWTATLVSGAMGDVPWQTSASASDTAPNSVNSAGPNHTFDNRLDSPVLSVTSPAATVTFRRNNNLEPSFDGLVLEISINGGPFSDIVAAGGAITVGPYNSTSSGGPLNGRQMWSGNSGGFVTSSATLPAAANGQDVVLRWRVGCDGSVGFTGAFVDSIVFTGLVCVPQVACGERFDLVTAPALPPMWTAASPSGPVWATVAGSADTAPNRAFVGAANNQDSRLDSRPFKVVSPSATVTFRRNVALEASFDGLVLEISIGGGPFADILAAGGSIPIGPYNSTSAGGTLSGRMMWSGNDPGFVTSVVNLPAAANGQNVVLRWRVGADSSVTGTGASIDTISSTGTLCTGCAILPAPNITTSNTSNQCGSVVTFSTPTTAGNCGPVTCSPASGSFFPTGTTTVTCTAPDNAGTLTSTSFTVTVNDTQPPTITCPANVVQGNDANQCGAVVSFVTTASDNCPGVTVACVPASGSFFPMGTTTVACTATDVASNTATCSFTVTVNDTQPPSITCPANVIATANTMQGMTIGAIVNYPSPTASDNCPGVTQACVPASGSFFPVGTNTVTCTATDAVGNTATCTFTVTVTNAFTNCYVDDGTGDTLSLVADPASPLYRLWQYHVQATNTTFQGYAEYISNVPGRALSAYDHDSPTVRMDMNVLFSAHTATATITNLVTGTRYVLRDRNILNDPPC